MNDILDQLITTYYYRRNPKFISNDEIFDFFIKNRDKIGYEDFLKIRRYFASTLNVYRRVFETIAAWYDEHDPDDPISIIDGKYKEKRKYPRMYNECRDAMRLKRYSPIWFPHQ